MKNFIVLILFFLAARTTSARTFFVTVSNFQFSPANIPNVMVGDTVQFNFAALNNHNAVSTPLGSVPQGASDINSGAPGAVTSSYLYVATVPGDYHYYCAIHSLDGVTGMVGAFTVSGVVPVNLVSFNAAYLNKSAVLNWQTATENNVDYFLVQKSFNAKEYADAGRIMAAGYSNNLQEYSFRDENLDPNARYIYYMLKVIDKDGRFRYSPVKLIRNEQANKKLITQIGPNPLSREVGHLMLQFNADKNTELKTVVINTAGKIVMRLAMSAAKGINNGHIHMADLPAGIYTVVFSMDEFKETYRVVLK